MILSRGCSYTNETSDLAITVKNILDETEDYYLVCAIIFNKRNSIMYENKNYKLLKENLKSWRKL